MNNKETVDYHIKAAWHSLSKMYNQEASKYDMTQSIGYVLLKIEKEGTPATKIAPLLGMEPTSLSRLLNSMEQKGMIYRQPDENDKRVVRIFLTEYGLQNRKISKQTILKFNDKLLQKVSENDLKTFYRVIAAINDLATEQKSENVKM
jgi:DNA-binding MarR family transcriptional regulator